MQELIETQTQDVNDVFVNLRQRPGGEVLDEMVEAALPAKRSGDDVGRKRAVSLIWHMLPAVGERGGKVDSFVGDGAERTIGRNARRRSHGPVSWMPGRRRWPARNSRASIGRRPSGCTRSMAIRSPCPVATEIEPRETSTIVPGAASVVSVSRCVFSRIRREPSRYEYACGHG
jgi:hypothetical protein